MDSINSRLPNKQNDLINRGDRKILVSNMNLYSKTIGTDICYPLKVIDISESGMKLMWRNIYKIPFIENTLIGVRLDIFRTR